ncbi:glycosyltransferase family 4 protein [Halalkalicoccus subterraneus]|uniref:glycosyltransferase family 4 protein n=1 Tax=Halalkalicoccus subterraneus TaxID=2675002 RepID=UPI000EFA9149|nr:glycosyltransferase family 4 protein [Halalkalicoccus subterraneus]
MSDDTLNVCLISKQFPPGVGGAETYAYELANGLAERGHRVDVYTQWIESINDTVDLHENVTVYRIAKARKKLVTFETLWFSFQARRQIDFDQYDIVHGTLMPASTIAVTPLNDIETPVVLTSHGTSIGETKSVALETPADYLLKYFFHPMNVVMDFVAGRGADEIVAISDHAADELVKRYRFDADHVQMVPHGVDVDRFYPREKAHPDVHPERTTLLYVGRLGARKGLDLALQAVAQVDDSTIELLIAGTGRHEDHLRDLAQELGIEGQIQFLGYVPDDELPSLYSSADVFVLPSRYEGFGLVLLEAMACGTPVIGTDQGGIPTVIDDGETGYKVERSVEQFTEAIRSLATSTEKRARMAQKARTKAVNTSWETVVEDVEELYEDSLNIV